MQIDLSFHRSKILVVAALLVSLAGCSNALVEGRSPQLPEVPGCLPERRVAPIHPSDTVRGVPRVFGAPEDMIAAGRVVAGGYAGLGYDTVAKVWTIQLVDTTALAAARVAIVRLARDTTMARALATAPAQRVRWSIAELFDWGSYIQENSARLPAGMRHAFVGIHYQRNVISFTLPDTATQRALEHRLVELGIPCATVGTQVGGVARVAGGSGR